ALLANLDSLYAMWSMMLLSVMAEVGTKPTDEEAAQYVQLWQSYQLAPAIFGRAFELKRLDAQLLPGFVQRLRRIADEELAENAAASSGDRPSPVGAWCGATDRENSGSLISDRGQRESSPAKGSLSSVFYCGVAGAVASAPGSPSHLAAGAGPDRSHQRSAAPRRPLQQRVSPRIPESVLRRCLLLEASAAQEGGSSSSRRSNNNSNSSSSNSNNNNNSNSNNSNSNNNDDSGTLGEGWETPAAQSEARARDSRWHGSSLEFALDSAYRVVIPHLRLRLDVRGTTTTTTPATTPTSKSVGRPPELSELSMDLPGTDVRYASNGLDSKHISVSSVHAQFEDNEKTMTGRSRRRQLLDWKDFRIGADYFGANLRELQASGSLTVQLRQLWPYLKCFPGLRPTRPLPEAWFDWYTAQEPLDPVMVALSAQTTPRQTSYAISFDTLLLPLTPPPGPSSRQPPSRSASPSSNRTPRSCIAAEASGLPDLELQVLQVRAKWGPGHMSVQVPSLQLLCPAAAAAGLHPFLECSGLEVGPAPAVAGTPFFASRLFDPEETSAEASASADAPLATVAKLELNLSP
ncbi:unnamed protein product, partial [Polarella glacialis]